MNSLGLVDVAVIGGGPAGLSAALWSARYRRRVLLVDAGRQRNRRTARSHGYLGMDDAAPDDLVERALADVLAYPEVARVCPANVLDVTADAGSPGRFRLRLDDGRHADALRLILATGVVDELPNIEHFDQYYGSAVFTCPTCDGYEAQGKRVVAIGDDEHISAFALGLLDWAASVALVVAPDATPVRTGETDRVGSAGVEIFRGTPTALEGSGGVLRGVQLDDGTYVACDVMFCTVRNVQHSDLASRLGCQMTDDGCVAVDGDGRTTVEHVFAAGDMTPGPHMVQVAAAEGARAGVAAALSLRGERGAPGSPHPAPEPSEVLSG